MKRIILIVSIFSLSGCMNIENPYTNLGPTEISRVGTQQLCDVANSRMYKPSENVFLEISRRGLRECSAGELYCLNLGLRYGTNGYASCRLQYQQYELNKEAMRYAEASRREQLQLERQKLEYQRMPTLGFHRNLNCNTQYSGNMAYTNCN